jgi:hypothetical protein
MPYIAKIVAIANTNHGPWLGGDFLSQKGEALQQFMATTSADDEWILQYRDMLAFDQGLPADSPPELLFEAVIDSKTFTNSGVYVPIFSTTNIIATPFALL